MVFEFKKCRKTGFSRTSGFYSVLILSPFKSAYSNCFPCRFWSCFDLAKYEKPVFLGLPVFCRSWFYHHLIQRTRFAFPAGFCRVLIWQSMKNRFFSDFRFFVGLDFIIIEISVVFYPYWPVFMWFQLSLVSITDISFLGNAEARKPVKMAEIGKSKIQVLIKVGYNLPVKKFSDLKSNVYSPWLEC